MRDSNSQFKKVLIFFAIPAIITIMISVWGYINTQVIDMKSSFIVFAGLSFFWLVISIAGKAYKELLLDFIKEDIRGKIIIILILGSMILKALYEIRLNK